MIDEFTLNAILSTLSETKETIEGINRFINIIVGVINTTISIIGFIGFKVLVLFIAVLFLSTGLAFIGIPKGKVSFFTSLTLVNVLWFFWGKSFNPESYSFMISMLKTNLILLIPFLLLPIFKVVIEFLFKKISKIFCFIKIPFIGKKILDKNEIISISEKFQEISPKFQLSLFKDILSNEKKDRITISNTTYKYMNDIEEIIKGFHKFNKKKK